MRNETREPRTFDDLWLMRETSKEWFDGQLRYENVRKGADPEVGAVDSVYWRVVPTSDRVLVCRDTHVICDVKNGGKSFSCKVEGETVAEYRSMAAFRDSEWWDLTMEKFAGGDTDASWLRSVELDGEDVDADPTWIGYGPIVTVSMEVGMRYRDWLGNTRQGKGHGTLDVRVERMSGELWLCHDGHEVEGTVEEIEAAMALVERLIDLGVKVDDGTITVPLPKRGGRRVSGSCGPAAVESCPVCGSPMARGERFRVQVLREAPVTWRSRTSWTWQMVGSTLACPGCAGAVGELLRRMGERW